MFFNDWLGLLPVGDRASLKLNHSTSKWLPSGHFAPRFRVLCPWHLLSVVILTRLSKQVKLSLCLSWRHWLSKFKKKKSAQRCWIFFGRFQRHSAGFMRLHRRHRTTSYSR